MKVKKLCVFLLIFLSSERVRAWAISPELFNYIVRTLKPGSTILEFGSGAGTGKLAKFYNMYSIEHDMKYLYRYTSTYIYAPIKKYGSYRWYDIEAVKNNMPKHYDLLLIDGPPGYMGRMGFLFHMKFFDTRTKMIFDDTNRSAEFELAQKVALAVRRPLTIFKCAKGKSFGVI
jgi:hypothetical protein